MPTVTRYTGINRYAAIIIFEDYTIVEHTPDPYPTTEDAASKPQPMSERDKLLKTARDLYGDDDIEIDDDAALSEADTHVWVSAWVCVPLPLEDHEAS
jgi:hypothetical protein